MQEIREHLERAFRFLQRHPNLDGSKLLDKEALALTKALTKYNQKAGEVELSLKPAFAETAGIIEAEGKSLLTPAFVEEFTRKHCSRTLSFKKINKKERATLLLLAAQDEKLETLRKHLDPTKKHRESFQRLLGETEVVIRARVLAMKPGEFQGMVTAVGLDAPLTKSGSISTAKGAKEKVIKQVLRAKESDDLMESLRYE